MFSSRSKEKIVGIDLDPTNEGTLGQLISFDENKSERSIVASSFKQWFLNELCQPE